MDIILIGAAITFVCAVIASIIATGDKVLAFLIALFLGPLGLMIVIIIEYSKSANVPQVSTVRRCRQCRKQISDTAYLCPHCNTPILK